MAHTFLVLLLILATLTGWSKVDRFNSEVSLGERRLDSFVGDHQPAIFQDVYRGKLIFEDELLLQNYFQNSIFNQERELSYFLKSELEGALSCTNEKLSEHFDEIRYSYRLITLSYLMEGQWHMQMLSKHLGFKNGCEFDFKKWLDSCHPQREEMKGFVGLLKQHGPKYEESLPASYTKAKWWEDYTKKDFNFYSHYRVNTQCKGPCEGEQLERTLKTSCQQDEALMSLICSENDELYGLSSSRDAYFLLAQSNIINTYNKDGEAAGCLRRFTEVMAHKEVRYPVLVQLFQTLKAHLTNQYQERFLQGRIFFYGSGKEFEEKGLSHLYVMEQPLKIAELAPEEPLPAKESPMVAIKKMASVKTPQVAKAQEVVKKIQAPEIRKKAKSSFLEAAEIRKAQNLSQVEVDMLKLKYDYVFSLHMINNLSQRLQTFMTREALGEMMTFDKLGTADGPVPLLFIKFMIDMQEHKGIYNLISVLGDEFYVSNEIDAELRPVPEKIKLVNTESTGRQWQIYILRP